MSADTAPSYSEQYSTTAFEELLGDTTRTRTLHYLIEHDDNSPHRQTSIASAIDVSQPMVSRVLNDFEDMNIVDRTPNGVTLHWTDSVHYLSLLIQALELEITSASTDE